MNKPKYCSVIGCGRRYGLKMVANPFAPKDEPITLCERCLRAGTEAVQQGKSELTQDIYEKYYINYPKKGVNDEPDKNR